MAKIISFPKSSTYAPLKVRTAGRHKVSVRVADRQRTEEARWHLQFAMQRAASFRCLAGFTDKAARSGVWHTFHVAQTFRIKRFLRDIEQLVGDGRVIVKIDGALVQVRIRKTA